MKIRIHGRLKRIVIFLICIIPILVSAQDALKEVLPPDIMPIIILSGSNYEMGYQYGQQAGDLIEIAKNAEWAAALQRLSREKVNHEIKAIQYYIRKFTPEAIDQIKGIADGATAAGHSVSYADVLLLNCRLPDPVKTPFPADAEKEIVPPKGCSVCSAWGSATRDGKLIGMDSHDIGDALFQLIIVAFPDNGNHYICGAQAGEIGDHFLMNNKGLFVGNSGGGGSPRDSDTGYGLSWACSLPHLVRFASSAEEARDMLLPWKINIPENFHFVDVKGNAFVVEKTSAIQAVRKPGDFGETDFLFSTNNYLVEKMRVTKTGDFIGKHGGYGVHTAIPRNMLLWDMLHNYHGKVDVDFIQMVLRFPGDGPPYPPEAGWETKVLRPSNSRVAVIRPDDGDNGFVYICTGPAGRNIPETIDPRGRRSTYPYIKGTHTFYKLTLAANPKAVIAEAKKSAKADIASAYVELMDMNFTDTGYAPLNDLYALANTEYYQGDNYTNKAMLSEGHKANYYFAKAATAYTRSQAHARQVYEALVPPPTNPMDLGLKPFGGDWATWETKVGRVK